MEEKEKLIEMLLEKATDYGKTSLELIKLKAVDKSSEIVSSFIPNLVAFTFLCAFMLFVNLGLAIWLGGITGALYLGFLLVSAFYILAGLIFHFLLHKPIKRNIRDYLIKQLLS